MQATTHKQDYFVALLHLLKRVRPLPFIKTSSGWDIDQSELPDEAGTYCLWWRGDNEYWQRNQAFNIKLVRRLNKQAIVKDYQLMLKFFSLDHPFPIPMFISKSRNLANRIKRQLMLDTRKIPMLLIGLRGIESQISHFRMIYDQLFPDADNVNEIIVNNMAYSYVSLEGDDNAFWRFYFTAYAIGTLLPLCNIDVIDTAAASLADSELHFDRRSVNG